MKIFNFGDKVLCDWGSGGAGFIKRGIVVDNNVKYNGNIKFDYIASENACIVRFEKGEKTWDGKSLGKNEVVPIRLIKKRG